ncbi:retrotransposon protein, putative, ty1-copia subclass [Tanacetum coccineum]
MGNYKQLFAPNPKDSPSPRGKDPQRTQICHECGETGTLKRKLSSSISELLRRNDQLLEWCVVQVSWDYRHRKSSLHSTTQWCVERENITYLDMGRRSMRKSNKLFQKSFWEYALGMTARLFNMGLVSEILSLPRPDKLETQNKVLVARNAEFLENSLIDQEASGSLEDLEIIQEDTHPSIDTSLNHEEDDLEMDEPQSDIIPIPRLVAKGYTQTAGIDYEGNPSSPLQTLELLGFFNSHSRFVNPKYPNRVCKLKLSIYGLKQASRQWNKRFDDEIKKFGFSQNADEPCVYLKAKVGEVVAKQSIFATSSAEAEYIAAYDASKEVVWVRKFISGLGVVPTIEKTINSIG